MSDLWVTPTDLDLLRDVLADSGFRYVHGKGRKFRGSTPGHRRRERTGVFPTATEAARALVGSLRLLYGDRWPECLPAGPGRPVPNPPPRRVAPPPPAPEEPPVAKSADPAPPPAPLAPRPGDPAALFEVWMTARRANNALLEQWAAGWLAECGVRVSLDGGPGA